MTGAMRSTRYTPAFTMVLECSSADTGVGATIAPSSQLENGSCADLVMPAKQSRAAGSSASAGFEVISVCNSMLPLWRWNQTIAAANASPPARFITNARSAFCFACSVCV